MLLVTGFSAFPGAGANPTERLVKSEAARRQGDRRLLFHVFETSYDKVDKDLEALMHEDRFSAALHLGLSHRVDGFQLEAVARNSVSPAKPDASGARRHSPEIRPGGAAQLHSTLPLAELGDVVGGEGLPWRMSEDAGDYLCNYLLYRVLERSRAQGQGFDAAFVHLPYLESQRPDNETSGISACHYLPDSQLERGLGAMIDFLLKRYSQ